MKKVAIIKFCSANEARSRARVANMERHMVNDTINGISEELYETFNNRPYEIVEASGQTISIRFEDEANTGFVWFIPKIFIDLIEI